MHQDVFPLLNRSNEEVEVLAKYSGLQKIAIYAPSRCYVTFVLPKIAMTSFFEKVPESSRTRQDRYKRRARV